MALDLSTVIAYFESNAKARQAAAHNTAFLKCVLGGLRMAQRHRDDFDPRRNYWRPPERRLTIAYLASKWTGRFAPPGAVRPMALRLLGHMDAAPTRGVVADGPSAVHLIRIAILAVRHDAAHVLRTAVDTRQPALSRRRCIAG